MPNLTLEYTANLPAVDLAAVLAECNRTAADSGQFSEIDIKSRAVRVDDFVIGTEPGDRGFVYVTFALLAGRSPEVKRDLSQRLQTVLQKHFIAPPRLTLQIAVEMRDMERDTFIKVTHTG